MPIEPEEIEVGGFYTAGNNQLRQVIAVTRGEDGNITLVDWAGKSANPPANGIAPEGFPTAPNRTNLPTVKTFCEACHKRLADDEIARLVDEGVLRQSEATSVYTIPATK